MIAINNLHKSFKVGNQIAEVLSGLSINIEKSKITAIIGRSGAGKTTLLNILCGLIIMDSGEYFFEGRRIDISNNSKADRFRNENFGIITQKPKLLRDYTVYENVSLPLHYAKIHAQGIKEIVTTTAKKLGIEKELNKYPYELSGGQQQRVAIARALIKDPKIILADEPTGSLDALAEIEIMELFKTLNEFGKTIIIVTHSSIISSFCDGIITIENGKAKK